MILLDDIGLSGIFSVIGGLACLSFLLIMIFYHTYDWRKDVFGEERTESNRGSKMSGGYIKIENPPSL